MCVYIYIYIYNIIYYVYYNHMNSCYKTIDKSN